MTRDDLRAFIHRKCECDLDGECPEHTGCRDCINQKLDEYENSIRADERAKAEKDFQNTEYWKEHFYEIKNDAFNVMIALEKCNADLQEVIKHLRGELT